MHTNIQKWGNSLGVRISKEIAHHFELDPGSEVELRIEGDHICIYPKKHVLNEMLGKINKHNKHNLALDEDAKHGAEEW